MASKRDCTSLQGRKFSDCELMAAGPTLSYPHHSAYYHVSPGAPSFHRGDVWLALHLLLSARNTTMMPYDPEAWSHHLRNTASSKSIFTALRVYPFFPSFMVDSSLLFYFRLSFCVGVFGSKEIGLSVLWPPWYGARAWKQFYRVYKNEVLGRSRGRRPARWRVVTISYTEHLYDITSLNP